MATQAYYDWVAAGRPFRRPPWLSELKALAQRYGVPFLGDLGNDAHLQSSNPQDHTPFSTTEWPVQISEYVINAIDLGDGPWSDRILADARAGRLPWLKYMNFRGAQYSRKTSPQWTGRSNSDQHLHLSGMSDHTWAGLNGYNPFIEEDDMADFGPSDVNAWTQAVRVETILGKVNQLQTAVAASAQRETDLAAAVSALSTLVSTGGGDVDAAAILARVDQRAAEVTALIEAKDAEIDALHARLAEALQNS